MKQAEIDELERRLANWRVWWSFHGDGGAPSGRCCSAERNYVAPRPDDEKAARRSVCMVDVVDAERIDEAMRRLPWNPVRAFLHCWYGRTVPLRRFLKAAAMTHDEVDLFRRRNLVLLSIELAKSERASVHLIRRGEPFWAGLAPGRDRVYKPLNSAPAERRGQADAWPHREQSQQT